MTDTLALRASTRRRRSTLWLDALAVIAWLAVTIPLIDALKDPPRASFALRNDTVWNLSVQVRTGPDSVMSIASIGAERSRDLSEVLIPGPTWQFIWRFGGDVVGRSVVPHRDLSDPDFVLTVPDEVEVELRARGAQPAP